MADSLPVPDGAIAVVLGTRPEIIKLAGVIGLLGRKARVIHTGQHYDPGMSGVFFAELGLREPDVRLQVGGSTRGGQIGFALGHLDAHFRQSPPVAVVVQGDTNATVAGALAANAAGIPVAHVEAGLRSFDKNMPEEHNRIITDHISDVLFAATPSNAANLVREGIPLSRIVHTGNTIVEAVHRQLPSPESRAGLAAARGLVPGEYTLATIHRPENTDDPSVLGTILAELGRIPCPVVLPLHPRTRAVIERHRLTSLLDGILVTEPLGGAAFLGLAAEAALLVSDSGGIQEECTVLKRPLIVVRRSTERPEAMRDFAVLVSPGELISKTAREWLDELPELHERLAGLPSPFGDGTASQVIVDELVRAFAR